METNERIIFEFTNHLREHGRYPESVYLFCRGAFYLHLRAVIDYYLMDDSKGFERTDAFVEKSAAVAFDLIRTQALDSAVDLARFLLPRRDACKEMIEQHSIETTRLSRGAALVGSGARVGVKLP